MSGQAPPSTAASVEASGLPTEVADRPGSPPLLDVADLHVEYSVGGGFRKRASVVRAVDGISFAVRRGRTLGLVGESGCGKTTTAKAVLRLVPVSSGRIALDESK